jgi:hypothetical protein
MLSVLRKHPNFQPWNSLPKKHGLTGKHGPIMAGISNTPLISLPLRGGLPHSIAKVKKISVPYLHCTDLHDH